MKIPDSIGNVTSDRIIAAICSNYQYQPQILDSDKNITGIPESQADFAGRMLDKFILENVLSYEMYLVRKKAEADYKVNPEAAVTAAKGDVIK